MADPIYLQPRARNELGYSNPDVVLGEALRSKGYDPERGYLARRMISQYSQALPMLMDVLNMTPNTAGVSDLRSKSVDNFQDFVGKFAGALTSPGVSLESALGVNDLQGTVRNALGTRDSVGEQFLLDMGDRAPEWLADFANFVDSLYGLTPAYSRGRSALRANQGRRMTGDLVYGRRTDVTPEDWLSIFMGQ